MRLGRIGRQNTAIQSNYGDGAQPHIKIGNEILEGLGVRPHFLLEFPCSSDTAWYAELLLSTEILGHAANCCDIEIKGKCLQGALFPELTQMTSKSCGHRDRIVLSSGQRTKIFNGVGDAILHVADISPAIDQLLSGGAYQLNGNENKCQLLTAASADALAQSIIQPVQLLLEANGHYYPVDSIFWEALSDHKPTGLDNLLKQVVRAQSVVQKIAENPKLIPPFSFAREADFFDSETTSRSMQSSDFEGPNIRQWLDEDGAAAMAQSLSSVLSGRSPSSGTVNPVILVQEKSAAGLLKSGDRDGAIRMCMADVAATCARCWYQLCQAKDPGERVASLAGRFRVVLYNGRLVQA